MSLRPMPDVDAAAVRTSVGVDVAALLPPADRTRIPDRVLDRGVIPPAQAAPPALTSLRRHHPASDSGGVRQAATPTRKYVSRSAR